MPSISLTDFVDVVSSSGSPKATRVAQIKKRPQYSPALDFYRHLRDGLVELHRRGGSREGLNAIQSSATDPKKLGNYQKILDGYFKWWGRRKIDWFDPPRQTYSHSGVDVVVNPELGLVIDGQRYVVKLYLKDEALSKLRVDLVTVLMAAALKNQMQEGDKLAVLDARRGRIFLGGENPRLITAMVNAELAYIASLWEEL